MGRKRQLPAGLVLRGKTYHANFRAHGRRVRKRLSTDFKAASELLNDLRARADRGDFGIVDNDYSWDELKAEFLKWKRQTSRNPEKYEADLVAFEKYCKVQNVQQITHEYVIGFRDHRLAQTHGKKVKRPISPRTVNRQVGTLRHMLAKAVTWGRIGANPVAGIKPLEHEAAKVRRALSVEEMESLFEESPEYLRPVWRMFACTGMRRSELVTLRFSDVDFKQRVAIVRASIAKSKKSREIPLDDETLEIIANLRAQAKDRQPMPGPSVKQTAQQAAAFSREHVFVTKANTPWRNNLLKRFYSICKRAGIEGAERNGSVDIHSLRVSFTTLCLENGASPKAVQAILGHSTLTMTMNVYAKATDQAKRNAVGALPFAKMSSPEGILTVHRGHRLATSSGDKPQAAVG